MRIIRKVMKTKEETNKQIVQLTVIARKLSLISVEILAVTGKAPDVEQLVRLAYERFKNLEILRAVLTELNPELMRPVPVYAGFPKTAQQIKMDRDLGAILYLSTRPLSNYPPAKYRKLIIKHLTVDKAGNVTLNNI